MQLRELLALVNINYPNDEWNWRFLDGGVGDVAFAGALACAYPVVRFLLDQAVFKPIGKQLIYRKLHTKKTDDLPTRQQDIRLLKFQESAWKALVYLAFATIAVLASYRERFLTNALYFWLGCKGLPCNFEVSKTIRLLYCLEMGFYAQAIPSLIFWEFRRKDYWALLGHHIATLVLIGYSFLVNFTKVGTMVFLLHDINDIFLETAKAVRYLGAKQTTTTVLFVLFVVSWFITRITIYPLYVLRSTLFDPSEIAKQYGISPHPHWEIFNGFLFFLFGLHIYWSYLILQIALRQVREGRLADNREEDDTDDD